MSERLDAEDLDVTPDDVLVLKNSGPVGAPGMPEAGYVSAETVGLGRWLLPRL